VDSGAPLYDVTTFWELVERRAEATPDAPMLFENREGGEGRERVVGFAPFRDWVERVASGFQQRGIGPGTTVAWQFPTRVEALVLTMALSRLGAVQVPIIALYRQREVSSLLRQAQATWFVVPSQWRDFDYGAMARSVVADAPHRVEVLIADELPEAAPANLVPPPTDGGQVRWIYATSGTTSEPKGVRHSDRSLIAGGVALAVARQPRPNEVGMLAYPCAHIGGPIQLVQALAHGSPLVLMDRFVADQAVQLMRRHHVTSAGASTAFYLAFLGEQQKQPGVPIGPSLRFLNGGGAPMPPDIFRQVRREMGIPIMHGFAMTECPMVVTGTPSHTDEQLAETVGTPVRGAEVQVRDGSGSVVDVGIDGDIWVRGPMLFKGYTNPELTAQSFDAQGFFNTGDRGHVRPDGHYVITGRTKELIIRKGENISPLEVEAVLQEHPGVGAVAVIGLPDAERGEYVCAVVEPSPGAEQMTFEAMQEHCRARGLMVQKIPERLEVVDQLPRNATMKILKTELKKRYEGPVSSPASPQLDAGASTAGDR
jgi:acyl-CoA synthetase (AMP-forming)/AMP-acid ligase II